MKRMTLAVAAALLAATGCAEAATRTVPITPVRDAPQGCALTVSFGSYAMGIDGETYAAVSRLLAHDRGMQAIEQYRWGREGELTLCARTRSGADARRLAARVKALVPAKPRGPVTVSLGARPGYRSSYRR
jgi:hypothetical protein